MISYTLFTFFIMVYADYLLINALIMEGIVGGHPANSENFPYQVEVFGKENMSIDGINERKPIGGGAIISEDHVVTNFLHFFTPSFELKKQTFYVMAGTDNINNPRIIIEIDDIYIPKLKNLKRFDDIAVVKLKQSFNFEDMQVNKIPIRQDDTSLIGQSGIVSGYGLNWIQTGTDFKSGKLIRTFGHTEGNLHFLNVDIVDNSHCTNITSIFNNQFQICAVSNLSLLSVSGPAGICAGDTGNPLVIDNVLVGLASLSTIDCNQNMDGAVYTNASRFSYFVNRVLENQWEDIAVRHKNRPFVPSS